MLGHTGLCCLVSEPMDAPWTHIGVSQYPAVQPPDAGVEAQAMVRRVAPTNLKHTTGSG